MESNISIKVFRREKKNPSSLNSLHSLKKIHTIYIHNALMTISMNIIK